MKITMFIVLSVLCFIIFSNDYCRQPIEKIKQKKYSLKEAFYKSFYIGAALSYEQVSGKDTNVISLIKSQFNSITPENCMKWRIIHPQPGVYDFTQSDKFVEFGEQNKMLIIGHILIDPLETPAWVFQNPDGSTASRAIVLERINEHISTVINRYKSRVNAWHVVNEAIGRDGKLNKCKWLETIGEDYIEKAFEFAHQADPDVELYYNGHDMLTKEATASLLQMVQNIKKHNGRIDGIGVQAHWSLDYPSLKEVEDGIINFSESGVKVMITEMDITVLPGKDSGKELNPYPDSLPVEIQKKLAGRYGELFEIFCKHPDIIDRVNFWGVHDGQSWLNNWPVRGRTNYPLLFDRNLKPKPAFYEVINKGNTAGN